MTTLRPSRLACLLLLPIIAAVAGCSGTTESGTPYTIKVDREMQAYIDAALATVHHSAVAMLEDEYLFEVYDSALDAREGIALAKTAKGRTVRIETYYAGPDVTQVNVYVSPMGDQVMQADLLSRLETRVN
ncbi:MAG: DUF3568 family protein [Phycisphaerales bacterium]|nr:DUF3568 family protein [Phycisphaerales bacterium]NNM24563.1 DUF3568 family protein [Phycisphaerales bacterium]